MLLLPAGPVRPDRRPRAASAPTLLPGGIEPELAAASCWSPSISTAARRPTPSARGERARDGLAAALMRLGAARFAAGDVDDLARLVPDT